MAALGLFSPTLPKASVAADKVAGRMPVPVKVACGLLVDALLTVRVAVSAPRVVGLNVTVMTQDFAARTLLPQVSVSLKSAWLVPVKAVLEMAKVCAVLL